MSIGYKKNAARAIGNANGHNQLPIFIPCHRVIQANKSLGGFIQGRNLKALNIKATLLALEGVVL